MASSFSIQAVAERTGLTPHVIRAWERRYRAIEPERSAGKQRLYSEAEIERLAMLSRAVRSGHSIGKIATLPDRGIARDDREPARRRARREEPRPATIPLRPFAPRRSPPPRASTAPRSRTRCAARCVALGNQGLLRLAIGPLAQEIGERWRTGELTAAHEHFFTASVKVFLGDLTRQFATPLNAPRIIVSTPTGQLHELGAVMAAATAANLGWRAIYLGPSLPAHEIAGAALRNEAAAVALSIVYPEDDPNLAAGTHRPRAPAPGEHAHPRRRPRRARLLRDARPHRRALRGQHRGIRRSTRHFTPCSDTENGCLMRDLQPWGGDVRSFRAVGECSRLLSSSRWLRSGRLEAEQFLAQALDLRH